MFGMPEVMIPREVTPLGEVHGLAVDGQRDVAEDAHGEPGGGHDGVRLELLTRRGADAGLVKVSMVSVTTDAVPSRSAANRSPSGRSSAAARAGSSG